jgi:hypothetical protein
MAEMRTTWRGIRRIAWGAGLSVAVGLQGCISPTNYARPETDEAQVTADVHDCAQWKPVVHGAVIGAGYGALAGVAVAKNGATDRNAAIVASVIALLYSIAWGVVYAEQDVRNYDRCMAAKGYHPV